MTIDNHTRARIESVARSGEAGGLVHLSSDAAKAILDMLSDLRYAGDAVNRAYRREPPDPAQLSLVERYTEDKLIGHIVMASCPCDACRDRR